MTVIAGRLLLLLAAAAALTAAIVLTHERDRDRAETGSTASYLCPMHPEVVSPSPGDCPICGMALERGGGAEKAPSSDTGSSRRVVDVQRRVVTQAVSAPAWLSAGSVVTAVLHKDELVGCASGERAFFFPYTAPAAGYAVRLSAPAVAPWDASTVQVRLQMEKAALAVPTVGWLQLAARPRELLVVPESAVLYSGEGAYVLAAPEGEHTFTRRSVEIGRILDSGHMADLAGDHFGAIVVLSGLRERERVVAGDTFFLDAERRLQAAQGRAAEVIE